MDISDIRVEQHYRTRSGDICKVTAIADDEDKTVSFIRYDDQHRAGKPDELAAALFAANLTEEIDSFDPQGKPLGDAEAATPA